MLVVQLNLIRNASIVIKVMTMSSGHTCYTQQRHSNDPRQCLYISYESKTEITFNIQCNLLIVQVFFRGCF